MTYRNNGISLVLSQSVMVTSFKVKFFAVKKTVHLHHLYTLSYAGFKFLPLSEFYDGTFCLWTIQTIFVWMWCKLLFLSFPASDVASGDSILSCCFRVVFLFCMLTRHNPKILRILTVVPDIFWCIIHSHTNTFFLTWLPFLWGTFVLAQNLVISQWITAFVTLMILWSTSWLLTLE
jgi:hypothetical protein